MSGRALLSRAITAAQAQPGRVSDFEADLLYTIARRFMDLGDHARVTDAEAKVLTALVDQLERRAA